MALAPLVRRRPREACLQRRRGERLEVAPAALRVGVLARDHLALLGEAQRAVDAPRRLREHRVVARPAAAADGAAAAVEQAQPHAARPAGVEQRFGRLVERPVGGEVAAVLVAVGIAEHHLLLVAAARDPAAVERQVESCGNDLAAVLQVADRLEERNDVELERSRRERLEEPRLAQQHADFEQVGQRRAMRDHVARHGARAVAPARLGGRSEDGQFLVDQV